jgi:hypothetical protein
MPSLPFRTKPELVSVREEQKPQELVPVVPVAEVLHAINQQIAAIPIPRDGIDGKSADSDAIVAGIRDAVQALLGVIPKDGEPGADGKDGRDGKDGSDGRDGRDAERKPWRLEVVRNQETGLIEYADLIPL